MSARLEADTCVLQVSSGQPQTEEPPGLAVFSAPRKAARGRERDVLFLCLGLRARSPLPAEQYTELLNLATQTFFGCSGSVTSALRQALTAVNQSLLANNLRAAASGLPAQGGLICAVLRGADFYAVQSGPGLVVVAHSKTLERFPALPGRAMGSSQTPDLQYFHSLVQAQEYFCLCNTAPEGWTEKALTGLGGLTTLTLALERLKETAHSDFAALVGRFETASAAPLGLPVRSAPSFKPLSPLFRPRSTPAADDIESLSTPATERESLEAPATLPAAPVAAPPVEEASPADTPAPLSAPMLPPLPEPEAEPDSEPAAPPATDWQALVHRAEKFEQTEPPPSIPIVEEDETPAEPEVLVRRPAPRPAAPFALGGVGARLQRGSRSFARALAVTFSEGAYNFRKLLARLLPEGMFQRNGLFAVPTSVQIGIAVAIPLVVVGLIAAWYIQRGQVDFFNSTLNEAMLEVANADMEPTPALARDHWDKARQLLEQARQLRPADATVASLWQKTQENLDKLDGVTRIDYQPLVANGLGRDVKIKQLLLMGQEVFLLDTGSNQVLHVTPAAGGAYLEDASFECSASGSKYKIGPLAAMALLPQPNLMDADAIIAMDKAGGLVYCALGKKPLTAQLTAPDSGWKNPVALQVYTDRLYVLDSDANEIWQFQASDGAFTRPPAHYFTGPSYNLSGMIDFAITATTGEVFLLRQDGRMADCDRRTSGADPNCVEVAQFSDPRPGRGLSERLWDVTQPAHLIYNPPPEPSLYLLDSGNSTLYRLSLKLELVQDFRSRLPLAGPITAVAIDTARIFVSAGDNVYVATRP